MPRQKKVSRSDRIRYFRAASDFWLEVTRIQKTRCLQESGSPTESRADLNFYVVAVQRLREVARKVDRQLKIQEAGQALDEFDKQWPRFKKLRDLEEHVNGPDLNAPAGIHYLGNSVADLQGGGRVEYIVHVEYMETAINKLHEDLCRLLDAVS